MGFLPVQRLDEIDETQEHVGRGQSNQPVVHGSLHVLHANNHNFRTVKIGKTVDCKMNTGTMMRSFIVRSLFNFNNQ